MDAAGSGSARAAAPVPAMPRRLFLVGLAVVPLAGLRPAWAADVVLNISFGSGDSTVLTLRDPRVELHRGGTVDGLPVLHASGAAAIDWRAMRHLVFIPGDPPAALITYRDGSQAVLEVERCRIVSGATVIDVHDVAEIAIR